MTDPLTTLLHDEASALDIPAPPADAVLGRGRAVRRRRRTTRAVAGAVAAVVVIAGVAGLVSWRHDDQVEPARLPDHAAYEQRGAWAVGNEVHVGNHVVEIPASNGDDRSVFVGPISYTSVGALVPYSDLSAGGAPHTTVILVRANGDTAKLGRLDGWASEPDSSVVVYSRPASQSDTSELVALDLASGEERTVGTPWQTNDAPQPGRSGDTVVYVRDHHMVMINWRTGETGRLTDLPEIGMTTMQSFGHGGYLTAPSRTKPTDVWHLRGLPDGELLGSFPDHGDGLVKMSPDGRFVMTGGNGSVNVYDLDSEKATPLELTGSTRDFGWTPDGHVVGPQGSHVVVCAPSDGACSDVGDLGGARLSLAHGASDSDPMAAG